MWIPSKPYGSIERFVCNWKFMYLIRRHTKSSWHLPSISERNWIKILRVHWYASRNSYILRRASSWKIEWKSIRQATKQTGSFLMFPYPTYHIGLIPPSQVYVARWCTLLSHLAVCRRYGEIGQACRSGWRMPDADMMLPIYSKCSATKYGMLYACRISTCGDPYFYWKITPHFPIYFIPFQLRGIWGKLFVRWETATTLFQCANKTLFRSSLPDGSRSVATFLRHDGVGDLVRISQLHICAINK